MSTSSPQSMKISHAFQHTGQAENDFKIEVNFPIFSSFSEKLMQMSHVDWRWSGWVKICSSGAVNSLQEKACDFLSLSVSHLFPQLCPSSPRSWASPRTFWLVSWANEGGAPHSCPIRTSRRHEGRWCHILLCIKTPWRCTDSSLYLKDTESTMTFNNHM